jgi:hypothetical protein
MSVPARRSHVAFISRPVEVAAVITAARTELG